MEKTEVIISNDGKDVNENSFTILRVLGKGYFGKVFLAEMKENQKLYALKVISKLKIVKKNFFKNLKNEKKILENIKNPFVVQLDYCFSNPYYVFFAMQFKQGGELYYHLRKQKRFDENVCRFYACQLLEGLIYLHSQSIMYRDMKPENILLDKDGNCCLVDFGISKILKEGQKAKSFVGTPEYVSPEIILQKGHDRSTDIWCFGILLYEMVYGIPPFYNQNQAIMLKLITTIHPTFPQLIDVSQELKDLIGRCLQKNPKQRIGYESISEIKQHPWFEGVSWEDVYNLRIQPPIKP